MQDSYNSIYAGKSKLLYSLTYELKIGGRVGLNTEHRLASCSLGRLRDGGLA